MYLISVVVGPSVWALLFKDENNALACLGRLRDTGDIDVQDEHGQRLCAKGGSLGPIMFENLSESKVATIERTLHDQKIRLAIGSRMQADPAFRTGAMQGGPPILTPMNGMGRG